MAPRSSLTDEVDVRTCIDCGGTGKDAAAVALERLGAVLPLSCGHCDGTGIDTEPPTWTSFECGYGGSDTADYEGHRLARQVVEDDPYRDEESIEFLLRHMRG